MKACVLSKTGRTGKSVVRKTVFKPLENRSLVSPLSRLRPNEHTLCGYYRLDRSQMCWRDHVAKAWTRQSDQADSNGNSREHGNV